MQLHPSLLHFCDGQSFLHRADARIKLGVLLVWQLLIWQSAVTGVAILLLMVAMLYPFCRVSLRRACAAMRIIIFLALFSLVSPLVVCILRDGWANSVGQLVNSGLINGRYALRLCTTALLVQLFSATTPIGTWADTIEWLLLPFRRLRSAVGLIIAVALNYLTLIQQYHHQVLCGLRARSFTRRRFSYRWLARYCLALLLLCARSATLSARAIEARKFSYRRSRPLFTMRARPTLLLVAVTVLMVVVVIVL